MVCERHDDTTDQSDQERQSTDQRNAAATALRCRSNNAAELAKLDAKIADAKEKFGEQEVFEANRDRADYYARVGDKVRHSSGDGAMSGTRLRLVQRQSRLLTTA